MVVSTSIPEILFVLFVTDEVFGKDDILLNSVNIATRCSTESKLCEKYCKYICMADHVTKPIYW